MLTPQEIKEKAFVRAVFGGYDMESVDSFILPLSEDYAALYKENSILKGKLKVLVETVEEYRSVDEAMRKALLNAQKMANDTLEEAREKSRILMDEAEEKAREKIESLRDEVLAEQKRLELARAQTAKFIAEAAARHRMHIEMLEKLPTMEIAPDEQRASVAAMNIKKAAEEIDQNLSAKLAGESYQPEADAEQEPENAEPEPVKESENADPESELVEAAETVDTELPGEESDIVIKSVTDFDDGLAEDTESDMKIKVFEFTIGEKNKIDDEITTELPAIDYDDDEDSVNPSPRYNFENLQFGKDYKDFSLKK